MLILVLYVQCRHEVNVRYCFLSERLEKELYETLPASMSNGIRVLPPPYGADSAWHGAKLISNVITKISVFLLFTICDTSLLLLLQ